MFSVYFPLPSEGEVRVRGIISPAPLSSPLKGEEM